MAVIGKSVLDRIKMRQNNDPHKSCMVCNCKADKALMMFDIKFGDVVVTICDQCNDSLFHKSLIATNKVSGKLKNARDIAIINRRKTDVEV